MGEEALEVREAPRCDPALVQAFAAETRGQSRGTRVRGLWERLRRRASGAPLLAPASRGKQTVLFYRDITGFAGGHLKVWDYFTHVLHSSDHFPLVLFSKRTRWDEHNPWRAAPGHTIESWRPVRPDLLFLAGLDWLLLDAHRPDDPSVPVLNLLQGFRHADPGDLRYGFLRRKAIRICVSEEVVAAVAETRQANGPVVVIPNGIDLQSLPASADAEAREWDLLIAALKQPDLGRWLLRRLEGRGRHIALLEAELPRPEFLARVGRARILVTLPYAAEGFHLPALEGMALGALVVCPDCVGNRSFCLPGHNGFRPAYTLQGIVAAVETALSLPAPERRRMLANARQTALEHDLLEERSAFLRILKDVAHLW